MEEHDFVAFPELTNRQLQEIESPHPQYTENFYAVCVKVTDGDTIRVETEDRDFDFPVRMLNIDSPEMSEGGKEAKEYVEDMILNEDVEIQINNKNRVGKYGRLLGKVISRGLDVGDAQLRLGMSVPFGKKNEGEPDNIYKTLNLKQWF